MLIYATAQDLGNWINPAEAPTAPIPDKADVLVRSASGLVTKAIRAAIYATDDDGMPTDAKALQAVQDATCAMAAAWSTAGIDPTKGAAGLSPIVTTKSLGGAAVSYGQSADIQQAIVDLASGTALTSEAWDILDEAGLISNRVGTIVNVGRTYALTDPLLVLGP